MLRCWAYSLVATNKRNSQFRNFSAIGDSLYRQAEIYVQKHKENNDQVEARRQDEQYESQSGIRLVKSIVKQHRASKKIKDEQETNYLEKARACMEEAGLVHGHLNALVSLANEILKSYEEEVQFKHIDGMKTVIDMNDLNSLAPVQIALKLYEYAGEKGSKEAWFNKGHVHWNGYEYKWKNETILAPPQIELALKCFGRAVELGDDDARYFLGVNFLTENETSDTRRRIGLDMISTAADNGHSGAMYYLSLLHRNGSRELGIEPNQRLFRYYLDQAADDNDGEALFMRAHCRAYGEDGYDLDLQLACTEFERAGTMNVMEGLVSAGAMYHNGNGVKQDKRRAFELYQLAGEGGSIEGWRNVAACYMIGDGVPKCENTAKYIIKTMLEEGT
jgi:TPR repeat protein